MRSRRPWWTHVVLGVGYGLVILPLLLLFVFAWLITLPTGPFEYLWRKAKETDDANT